MFYETRHIYILHQRALKQKDALILRCGTIVQNYRGYSRLERKVTNQKLDDYPLNWFILNNLKESNCTTSQGVYLCIDIRC